MNARQGHSISLLSALLLIYTNENTGSNRTDGRSYEQVGQSGILVTKFRKGGGGIFNRSLEQKRALLKNWGRQQLPPLPPTFVGLK